MNDMPSLGTKGVLPEGYRPPTDIIGFGYIRGTNTSGQILVNSAGEVATWCNQNNTRYFSGSVCFVVEQHSVSQWCLIAHNSGTSYAPYSADDLSKYKMVSLVAATKDYRPLASTVFTIDFLTMYCTSADKAAACIYAPEPNAYTANVYYQNSKIYIKSTSTWDTALLIAF